MDSEKDVEIFGQHYRIKGDDPERIEKVAGHVDQVMSSLLGSPGQGLSTRGAVLTALNIADEWFKQKDEVEKTVFELSERMDELLSLLPE